MFIRFKILLLILAYPLLVHAQTGRALVVAIGRYPEASGWAGIHGDNDPQIILPMLHSLGYARENINVLANHRATLLAIREAFVTLARQTAPGDRVYIHFSCHGQQMVDDDGDEDDGLDEALIPYDAQRRYVIGRYEGENHLRDDELGKQIDTIRHRAGPAGSITVVLDACHSGTGTREERVYVRGTGYLFAPPHYTPVTTAADGRLRLALAASEALAPCAVFSACAANQKNYEHYDPARQAYYGSLTFALSRILARPTPHTPAQLAAALQRELKTLFADKRWTQTPVFESTNENDTLSITATR